MFCRCILLDFVEVFCRGILLDFVQIHWFPLFPLINDHWLGLIREFVQMGATPPGMSREGRHSWSYSRSSVFFSTFLGGNFHPGSDDAEQPGWKFLKFPPWLLGEKVDFYRVIYKEQQSDRRMNGFFVASKVLILKQKP